MGWVTWAPSCLCPSRTRLVSTLESVVTPWEGVAGIWGTTGGLISYLSFFWCLSHDPVQQLCGMSQHRMGQPQHVAGWGTPLLGAMMPKQTLQSEVQGQEWVRQNRPVFEASPGEPHCLPQGSLPDDAWGVALKPTHPPASQLPQREG